MIKILDNYYKSINKEDYEFVERKWIWHPDTLSDLIAEIFVINYSNYTKSKYWYIPNHWVDKVLLSGAKSEVKFWDYKIIKPIRCYLFWKVTQRIENEDIPIYSIFRDSVVQIFTKIFKNLDILNYIDLIVDVNDGIWAGRPKNWYQPKNTQEVQDSNNKLRSNDSVICSAYSPLSWLEKIVIFLENYINWFQFKKNFSFTGYDVKVLANRRLNDIDITICIPFLAKLTPNKEFYYKNIEIINTDLKNQLEKYLKLNNLSLNINNIFINNRDEWDIVYMVPFWSALDTWDYGVVGRWNKYNWVISIVRESNIEAFSWKNPMYHGWKLFNYIAWKISEEIYLELWYENYVNIVAKVWDNIDNPHEVLVKIVWDVKNNSNIVNEIVNINLKSITNIHEWLLNYNPILRFNPNLYE
jgi:S-adenosylmethionine synthetase